jgi:glycosyltransferase involved in cell wall biosynthesis
VKLRDRAARALFGERPPGAAPFGHLRVATIVDEFTRVCLEPEVTLLAIDARTWRVQLPVFQPHLLFVESAWRGAHDSWKKRVATYPDHGDDTLASVVRWCRRREIPTVFWNKEDPVHFDRFIAAATQFDHVFTTEIACVDRYRAAGLAGRVDPLLFAAQPALHYPGSGSREDVVCFAGSYGEAELGARRTDLEALLDGALDFPLRILDRQAGSRGENTFPARYQPFVRPGVGYRELAELQRRYKVFLNVNAIRDSRTMFSRRVFELLASGAAVVSSPNEGIRELFGDIVAFASTPAESNAAIRRFLEDDAHREAIAARGIERVAAGHTYACRVREVCLAVGLPAA